jgi:hypothetical protein
MATAWATYRWMLWTFSHDYPRLSDEFIDEQFRIRLLGNVLELTFEGSGVSTPESAELLAGRYVEALSKLLVSSVALMTEKEFLIRTAPPFGGMLMASRVGREDDPGRAARAVRGARNECLASADPWLRRCYDHLQDAREQVNTPKGNPAYDAYKAMEVLVERFESGDAAVAALGKTVKVAKWVADERRHIPKKGRAPAPAGDPLALATEAVRSYERHLHTQTA